jgi:hypothetical protein
MAGNGAVHQSKPIFRSPHEAFAGLGVSRAREPLRDRVWVWSKGRRG